MNLKTALLLYITTLSIPLYCPNLDSHRTAYFKFESTALFYIHRIKNEHTTERLLKTLQRRSLSWKQAAEEICHKASAAKAAEFSEGLHHSNPEIVDATLKKIFDEYHYIYLKKRPTS